MTTVTVKRLAQGKRREFYTSQTLAATARRMMAEGCYEVEGTLSVDQLTGADAAEEVFDLTNNPSRTEECEERYLLRSVTVGDILTVDGVDFLCAPIGWEKISS